MGDCRLLPKIQSVQGNREAIPGLAGLWGPGATGQEEEVAFPSARAAAVLPAPGWDSWASRGDSRADWSNI